MSFKEEGHRQCKQYECQPLEDGTVEEWRFSAGLVYHLEQRLVIYAHGTASAVAKRLHGVLYRQLERRVYAVVAVADVVDEGVLDLYARYDPVILFAIYGLGQVPF